MNTGKVWSMDVYYRLYKSGRNGLITVVCMQDFDEIDYYPENFVRNDEGEAYYFNTAEEAKEQLNKWYKSEEIDDEFRITETDKQFLIR